MDLDGLKAFNDGFGHAAGDNALVSAAAIMRATVRETDIVARIGGDEFAAVLVGVALTTHRAIAPAVLALSAGGLVLAWLSGITLELVRASLAWNQMTTEEQNSAVTAASKADVTINPRYGTFDPAKVRFDVSTPNWIKAEPAPVPQG